VSLLSLLSLQNRNVGLSDIAKKTSFNCLSSGTPQRAGRNPDFLTDALRARSTVNPNV
jgi:hypothetical protein